MAEATVPEAFAADTQSQQLSSTQRTEALSAAAAGAYDGTDGSDTENAAAFLKERFEVELEFVQCLANPWYVNIIAQQGYFDKPEFINYLKYLMYWRRPEYARFVVYPHALAFLDLLQNKSFRDEIKKIDEATRLTVLQQNHWRWPNYREEGDAAENEHTEAPLPR
ncbi:suppressor of hpr1 [Coemansia sp. Benny D160-2]|nr:suppressor of hpr1 [Coemansia sp. Benny D160-2]